MLPQVLRVLVLAAVSYQPTAAGLVTCTHHHHRHWWWRPCSGEWAAVLTWQISLGDPVVTSHV